MKSALGPIPPTKEDRSSVGNSMTEKEEEDRAKQAAQILTTVPLTKVLTQPVSALKPLIIILGGIRSQGGIEYVKRRSSKATLLYGNRPSLDIRVRQWKKVKDADGWKAARRFIVNSQNYIKEIAYSTPIGLVALKTDEPLLYELRERMYEEVKELNKEARNCHVVVELTWNELGEEATGTLRMLMGDNLPNRFYI